MARPPPSSEERPPPPQSSQERFGTRPPPSSVIRHPRRGSGRASAVVRGTASHVVRRPRKSSGRGLPRRPSSEERFGARPPPSSSVIRGEVRGEASPIIRGTASPVVRRLRKGSGRGLPRRPSSEERFGARPPPSSSVIRGEVRGEASPIIRGTASPVVRRPRKGSGRGHPRRPSSEERFN